MLFSIAYNMLGTIADAEDMVQETYIAWVGSDKSHIENVPAPWFVSHEPK